MQRFVAGPLLLNTIAKKMYSLPEGTMEDLKAPLVNAPVVSLYSGAVIFMDGDSVLKDALYRKNETAV